MGKRWTRGETLLSRCMLCWRANNFHCKLLFLSLRRVFVNGLRVLIVSGALGCAK